MEQYETQLGSVARDNKPPKRFSNKFADRQQEHRTSPAYLKSFE